ncbi:apolipoprotein N-acyltransferase [Cytophagales bacterium RKSG123]|nr:apolipoprotein N-acyltransferase [Xanthovirga aplysinae]
MTLSLLSGFLFWLGWPVKPFTFLLFLALVPLLAIEDHIQGQKIRRSSRRLFLYVYLATFLWNLGTTWWIYNVDKIAVIPAVVINALFMTFPFLGYHWVRKRSSDFLAFFSLVLFWCAFEYIHLNWDLSWPWLTLGNGFAMYPQWVQWYEYTGVFGGTLWIWGINILFFILLFKGDAIFHRKVRWMSLTYTLLLILIPIFISYRIYNNYEGKGRPVEVVVMQPNIDPFTEKFADSKDFIPFDQQIDRFIHLSEEKITPNTSFLVWPETAIDNVFNERNIANYKPIQKIINFKNRYPKLALLTGITSYTQYGNDKNKATPTARFGQNLGYYDVFNTGMFISDDDKISFYHKSKLVPGAELFPYPKVFGPLRGMMLDLGGTGGGFGRQSEPTVFKDSERLTVAPAICYESIYGEFMAGFIQSGAQMIFIITNDGWWGNTAGHKQHLHYASLRAIEGRRSIARSANTGISAFINQRGDILQPTTYWTQDVIRGTILANDELTFYAKHGDYLARNALWLGIFIFLSVYVKERVEIKSHRQPKVKQH